jgi:hypothetical protein
LVRFDFDLFDRKDLGTSPNKKNRKGTETAMIGAIHRTLLTGVRDKIWKMRQSKGVSKWLGINDDWLLGELRMKNHDPFSLKLRRDRITNWFREGIMKKSALYKATVIAFVLIPLLAVVRLIYRAPQLDYGHGEITVNSVFLLLFSIYAFFVSIFNFIRCHDSWKTGKTQWKIQLTFTYIFVFIFALSLPFLMMFQIDAFETEDFIPFVFFVSPAFLFPIGIVLFFLGFVGLENFKLRSKSYLVIIFSTSILFVLGGALSAAFVFAWWTGGGINLA